MAGTDIPNNTPGFIKTSTHDYKAVEPCKCPDAKPPSATLEQLQKWQEELPNKPDDIRKQLDAYIPSSEWQKGVQGFIDSAKTLPYDNSSGGGFWTGVGRVLGNTNAAIENTKTEVGQAVLSVANRLVFGVVDLAKMIGARAGSPTATMNDILTGMIAAEMGRLGMICTECITAMAKAMGKELVKPITDAWDNGQYVRAITEGGLELLLILGPIVAKVGQVTKAARAAELAKAGRTEKIAEGAKAGAKDAGAVVEKPAKPSRSKKPKLEPGSAEHKAARWKDYQERGGTKSYEQWSKQYDANMQNYKVGLEREVAYRDALGAQEGTVKTALTNRQIDILKADEMYAGQLKTGPVSLTTENALAIQKDAWLVEQGWKVEHILEKGASQPYLDALTKAGIDVHVGPKIPK